jgi:hypothetical protein
MPRDLSAPTAVALDVQPVYRTADSLRSFPVKIRCIERPNPTKYKEYAFFFCGAKGQRQQRQISMPSAELFAIPAIKRPKTYALGRTATGIGNISTVLGKSKFYH